MDARLVWDTWRRILTEDVLAEKVVQAGVTAVSLGLSPDEASVFADYASIPHAAELTIRMYRRGLPKNALSTLNLVPLARRLLATSGLDRDEVAEEFVRSIQYRDDGPNFWRTAEAFTGFLLAHASFSSPAQQSVLRVEHAAAKLMQSLAPRAASAWSGIIPLQAGAFAVGDAFLATSISTLVVSSHDITTWLEEPNDFDAQAVLPEGERHWLVYVPDRDSAHTYAEISVVAAHAYGLLAESRTLEELATLLGGQSIRSTASIVASLSEVGAVVRLSRAEGARPG